MAIEDGITEAARLRLAELRRAIAAGEYAPNSQLVAGEILAKVRIVGRVRRRIEALDGPRFEPEARPPARRFAPRTHAPWTRAAST